MVRKSFGESVLHNIFKIHAQISGEFSEYIWCFYLNTSWTFIVRFLAVFDQNNCTIRCFYKYWMGLEQIKQFTDCMYALAASVRNFSSGFIWKAEGTYSTEHNRYLIVLLSNMSLNRKG